jgi:protein tyrosine/serine phosphatase
MRAWLWKLAVVVAAVIVFAVLWDTTLRDRLYPRRFGVVVPGAIYRCAQVEANLADDVLREHGIRHIINLGVYKAKDARHAAELTAAEEQGVTIEEKGLGGDGLGDPQAYVEALREMVEARRIGQAVLVHCSAGQNRTGAAVALYRVLIEGWTPAAAVAEMKRYDFDPQDNTKLLPYLDENWRTIARGLRARGVAVLEVKGGATFAAGE